MITDHGIKILTTAAELQPFHLLPGEVACSHCGVVELAELAAKLFLCVRTEVGRQLGREQGLVPTSVYRCREHQQWLKDHGYHAADPSSAPHCFACAMDLRCPPGWTQGRFAHLILDVANRNGFKVRVGWLAYPGQGFVHFDVTPYLTPNPRPVDFADGVTW